MNSIWVVDDHSIIRQGIKQILADEGHPYKVTAEAGSVADFFKLLETQPLPRVLLLDLSMPGPSGLELLSDLKRLHPELPVLILSVHPEDQYAIRCLRAGAAGYLSKECAPEQLVQALNTILNGQKYLTSQVANLLTNTLRTNANESHKELSDREFQTLILIAQGRSLTEISKQLELSVKTISTYRSRILSKLNLKTNSDLVQYALRHKLLTSLDAG